MRRPSWLDPHATERRAWITTACLVILTTGAVIAALDIAQDILAPTALAILLAVTLSPVQSRLARNGLGEKLGAAATVLAVLAAIATATWALLPSYEEWRARGPALFREAGRLLSQMEKTVSETVEEVQSATGVKKAAAAETPATAPVADATQQTLFDWLLAAPGMAATVLFVAFLTFFLLAERRQVFRALTGLIASDFKGRLQIARALKQLNRDIARYFLLVSTINAGLGVCVAIAFTLVGMPNAALWGAAMALLNFVPYLGAAIANVVVFVVALVTFGSLSAALLPTVALLALNTLEGQLITPILVGRSVAGSAVMVFLSVAFGAWLWGAVGALLATPLLIVGKAVIVRLSNARHA